MKRLLVVDKVEPRISGDTRLYVRFMDDYKSVPDILRYPREAATDNEAIRNYLLDVLKTRVWDVCFSPEDYLPERWKRLLA